MMSAQAFLKIALFGLVLSSFSACGQKGPLLLPKDPAAADRATLPQTLLPDAWRSPVKPTPAEPKPHPETPQTISLPQAPAPVDSTDNND